MPIDSNLAALAAELRPGSLSFLILCLSVYGLFASCLAYALFGIDAARRLRHEDRVRDEVLLVVSALGGWPGAKVAQLRLGHKRHAQPFGTLLNLIVAAEVAVLLAHAVPLGVVRTQSAAAALTAAEAERRPGPAG
ncbi:MAG: DUF1294 domain-containing protein [Rhodobacterales bacterium]|nr:DUF1294 domain-containing protein [Rhodobacterales bacterium]